MFVHVRRDLPELISALTAGSGNQKKLLGRLSTGDGIFFGGPRVATGSEPRSQGRKNEKARMLDGSAAPAGRLRGGIAFGHAPSSRHYAVSTASHLEF